MNKLVFAIFCAVVSVALTKNIARAANLTDEQKVQLENWQASLDDKSVTENTWIKEMCGKEIPIKMDASLAEPFMTAGNSANYYCREVREKLSTMCRNAAAMVNEGNKKDNKKLINTMIDKITCTLSKGAEDDAKFEITKGELIVSIGPKASNISEKLLSTLLKKYGFNAGKP